MEFRFYFLFFINVIVITIIIMIIIISVKVYYYCFELLIISQKLIYEAQLLDTISSFYFVYISVSVKYFVSDFLILELITTMSKINEDNDDGCNFNSFDYNVLVLNKNNVMMVAHKCIFSATFFPLDLLSYLCGIKIDVQNKYNVMVGQKFPFCNIFF